MTMARPIAELQNTRQHLGWVVSQLLQAGWSYGLIETLLDHVSPADLDAFVAAQQYRPQQNQDQPKSQSRLYFDTRTGDVLPSPVAPDARSWYRIVHSVADADRAFDEGEFPIMAPMSVDFSQPARRGEHAPLLEKLRFQQYEGDAAPFRGGMLELQRRLGLRSSQLGVRDPHSTSPQRTTQPAGGADVAARPGFGASLTRDVSAPASLEPGLLGARRTPEGVDQPGSPRNPGLGTLAQHITPLLSPVPPPVSPFSELATPPDDPAADFNRRITAITALLQPQYLGPA